MVLISTSQSISCTHHCPTRFQFPSNFTCPAISFSWNSVKASLPSVPATATTSTVTVSNADEKCIGVHGRRRTMLLATTLLPLLDVFQMNRPQFSALAAAEFTAPEYQLMKDEIRNVVTKGKAAGVLRLVFHDAGTFEIGESSGGMNGSIKDELDRPENTGLNKSLKIVAKAKSAVDATHSVSWADMISVAGAEAVSICGGPDITVRLGRLDSLNTDPEGKLPEESLNASELKDCFRRKGFSTQELVALSGAHTLGSKGFGSPVVFDNTYYKILLEKPWKTSTSMPSMIGLPTDHALVEDEECSRWIKAYAADQNLFFEDFKEAYIKLVNSGAKWKKTS